MDKVWFHKAKDKCRWWLHFGKTILSYEGYLGKNAKHNHIEVKYGGEENDVTFMFGVKRLFNFYIGIEDLIPMKWKNWLGYDGRYTGISLFEEYISIDFHRDDMGLSEGWKGIHWMINWKNILFGKETYRTRDLETGKYEIKMPEGNYLADVRVFESTWTRKRFVKPVVKVRYDIEPEIPIPEPPKGESGYDLDEDALHAATVHGDSIQDALKNVSKSVIKTRKKRAGDNWIPENGFPV